MAARVRRGRGGAAALTHDPGAASESDKEEIAALRREALAAHDAGDLEAARCSYARLLQSRPNEGWIYNNLGHVFHGLGAFTEAETHYRRAIDLDPALANAHWNLCSLQLLLGDFESAWPRFHYRRTVSRLPVRAPAQPVWDGGDLEGRTILLHKEFGFGDTIQFARYVPLVAARGGRVVLEVQRELMRLFQTLEGVEMLVTRGTELPHYDSECGLMELACVFGTTLENIPSDPYLSANRVLAQQWRKRLRDDVNVGIVWSGNPNFPDARYKCIDWGDLAPLFDVPGVTWVPLQTGAAAADMARAPKDARVAVVTDGLTDFAETAAVIANLELVITVDTAVAHLAGALGTPVWLLLPSVPDWRWFVGRSDSPWYPTMRLFRQTERAVWAPVVERVAAELRARVAARRPQPFLQRLRRRFGRTEG